MMKFNLANKIITLLFFLLSSLSFPANAGDTVIFYINGAFNSNKNTANESFARFRRILSKNQVYSIPVLNGKIIDYSYWVRGDVSDPGEITLQQRNSDNALIKARDSGATRPLNITSEYLHELGKSYDFMINHSPQIREGLLWNPYNGVKVQTSKLADNIEKMLLSGNKIIFVGHSQGNLYIESALAYLQFKNGKDFLKNIRVLGLGSVSASTYNNKYISLTQDKYVIRKGWLVKNGEFSPLKPLNTACIFPCVNPNDSTDVALYSTTFDENNHGAIKTYFNDNIFDVATKKSLPTIIAETVRIFARDLNPTLSISPLSATISKDITFTITGGDLRGGMGFAVQDCSPSNNELPGGTATQRKFRCTFNSTPGVKSGVLKDKPDGTILSNFSVTTTIGTGSSWLSTITPPDYIVKNIINIDFDNLPNGAFSGTGQYLINKDSIGCHLTQDLAVSGIRKDSAIDIQTTYKSSRTTCTDGTHTAFPNFKSNYSGILNTGVLLLTPHSGTCDFFHNSSGCHNFTSFSPTP